MNCNDYWGRTTFCDICNAPRPRISHTYVQNHYHHKKIQSKTWFIVVITSPQDLSDMNWSFNLITFRIPLVGTSIYPGMACQNWGSIDVGSIGPSRAMDLLPDTQNFGLRMRRECRGLCYRLQRKPRVGDPGMHHGTCVTHVPWCMSGSPTRDFGENAPGIPGACATRDLCVMESGAYYHSFVRYFLCYGHCWYY